jgi:hypothetical protein
MPDSYGKRQRNAQKARKFAAREERRAARKQERADREAGVPIEQTGQEADEAGSVTDGEESPGIESQGQPESSDEAQVPGSTGSGDVTTE